MGEAKRKRELPSLRDWLAKMVPSANATDRDAYADYSDWVGRMLDHAPIADSQQARLLRMIQATSLAIVESCNREVSDGTDVGTISADMCKCLGLSFGYALMSLKWKDDTPFRSFVRPVSEEFVTGLKFAIDECLEAAEREPSPALMSGEA